MSAFHPRTLRPSAAKTPAFRQPHAVYARAADRGSGSRIRLTIIAAALVFCAATACEPGDDHAQHAGHGSSGTETSAARSIESAPAGRLSALEPRIRAVPPGVRVTAAYLWIANRTAEDDRLVAARMDGAGRVEIHATVVDDAGVMRMRPLADGLAIPAGESVELKPGGLHIMLMDLEDPPRSGETRKLELDFERSGTQTIPARVFDEE
jgi:copper(I)-binding protein